MLRRFSEAVLGDAELSLVGAVVNGAAALAMLPTSAPDVVLLDLGLPDMGGIEVIRNIAAHNPQREVLVVTMFADDQHVFEALEAGATGYLLKDLGLDRIASSIPELRAGGSPISPSSARRPADRGPPGAKSALLTPREIELLRLTAKGLSFDNVGELMGVSPHTVVAHVKKIYRKLAVHSRGEAVFEATQMGRL